jgi:hypothetical protein
MWDLGGVEPSQLKGMWVNANDFDWQSDQEAAGGFTAGG